MVTNPFLSLLEDAVEPEFHVASQAHAGQYFTAQAISGSTEDSHPPFCSFTLLSMLFNPHLGHLTVSMSVSYLPCPPKPQTENNCLFSFPLTASGCTSHLAPGEIMNFLRFCWGYPPWTIKMILIFKIYLTVWKIYLRFQKTEPIMWSLKYICGDRFLKRAIYLMNLYCIHGT